MTTNSLVDGLYWSHEHDFPQQTTKHTIDYEVFLKILGPLQADAGRYRAWRKELVAAHNGKPFNASPFFNAMEGQMAHMSRAVTEADFDRMTDIAAAEVAKEQP